jgi:hypothetical protein
MTCTIVAAVVSCLGTSPVPPADAVAVFAATHPPIVFAPRLEQYEGPQAFFIPSSASSGPFGEFTPFPPSYEPSSSYVPSPYVGLSYPYGYPSYVYPAYGYRSAMGSIAPAVREHHRGRETAMPNVSPRTHPVVVRAAQGFGVRRRGE